MAVIHFVFHLKDFDNIYKEDIHIVLTVVKFDELREVC